MLLRLQLCVLGCALLVLTGCEHYVARPLQCDLVVLSVEHDRRLLSAHSSELAAFDAFPKVEPVEFSFNRAVELMKTHSPALKEARAAYDKAQALAEIKTPLPNPAFEVGPNYGYGADTGRLYRFQPFGVLGFAIPTGQRLKRQDELNCAMAGMAWVEIQAKHRELYLELRKNYTRLAVGVQRIERRRQLAESAGKSAALTQKQIAAGLALALDAGLIELEQYKLEADASTAELELSNVRGDLAQTIGVHAEHFDKLPAAPLPALLVAPPALPELQKMLVDNHPELARLRAKYEIAERQLHLEIARQYPDFKIGPSYDHERGERITTLGLRLGIDLPAFDKNQQAIATAKEARDEVRTQYEAAANRALAGLDRAYFNCKVVSGKLKLYKDKLVPRVEANLGLAEKAVKAGEAVSLKILEAERSQRAVLLDALDTELLLRGAWSDLEQAVGMPLISFPTEAASGAPALTR